MERATREAIVGLTLGAALTAAALAIARGSVRHLELSDAKSSFVVFFGGATIAVAAVASSVRSPMPARVSLVGALASVAVIVATAIANRTGFVASIAVDVALVVGAVSIGALVGTRIEHAGHLLPAGFIGAAADVASIASPQGVTHQILESERSLSFAALSFPVPGTTAFAPVLGVGDLIFVALALGALRRHTDRAARGALLAYVGVALAGLVSALTAVPVPALPMIAGAIVIGVPEARATRPKERGITRAACIGSVVVAAGAIASAWLRARG